MLPFFKKKEAKSASPMVSQGFTLYMSGGQVYALGGFDVQQVLSHYKSIAPLNTAVTKITRAAGALPLCLRNTRNNEIMRDHPLLTLLNAPNRDYQKTKRKFFETLLTWKLLAGDAYIAATGNIKRPPLELHVLASSNITVIGDPYGYVNSYHYTTATKAQAIYLRDERAGRFYTQNMQQELLHIGSIALGGCEWDSMSAVVPLYIEVLQYMHASQHNLGLLMNGARPSGALMLKGKDGSPAQLSTDQFARLKEEMESQFSGSSNSGRPLLLEGGLEWQEMSINAKDMDWIAGKKDAEYQIYKSLGVPLPLVSTEKATYNNVAEARLDFYEATVIPHMEDLMDYLDMLLIPRYPDLAGWGLGVDTDSMQILLDRRVALRESVESDSTATLNEKREELGRAPIAGGDAVFTDTGIAFAGDVPATVTPVDPLQQAGVAGAGNVPKSLERKNIITVDRAIDDYSMHAATTELSRRMYEELVEAFGADMVRDLTNAIAFEQSDKVQSFIHNNTGEFITNINTTTRKALQGTVADAFAASETLDQIAARVGAVFDDATQARLDTIAITETTKVAGFTAREALDQAGIERAVWMAVSDGNARDAHAAMDGQVSDDAGFFRSGSYKTLHPGGFGVAALDINCRCAIRGAVEGEKAMSAPDAAADLKRREKQRAAREVIVRKYVGRIFAMQRTASLALLQ